MNESEDVDEGEGAFETVSSSEAFVRESTEFLATLGDLLRHLPTGGTSKVESLHVDSPLSHFEGKESATSPEDYAGKYARLGQILDSYQEQSHLLDPYLDDIIRPCMLALRKVTSAVIRTVDLEGLQKAQELLEDQRVQLTYRFIYNLCKVRGYKTALKFFTHEVADLEPTLQVLLIVPLPRANHALWEMRYILLLHLSLASMVPFDLSRLDSGKWGEVPGPGAPKPTNGTQPRTQTLVERMVELGKVYLHSTGKEGEGAAVMLSRLLTRKDTVAGPLQAFLFWATDVASKTRDIFLLKHTLQTLALIYKLGQRDFLLPTLPTVTTCVVNLASSQGGSGNDPSARWDPRTRSNSLMRKLVVKLTGRVGTSFLPPRKMTWVYRRGQRSLHETLPSAISGSVPLEIIGPASTNTSVSGLLGFNPLSKVSPSDNAVERGSTPVDDEEFDPPPSLEDILDILLSSLRDRDTVVRWSSAKALGRVASRLPSHLAQDVVSSVLDLFREDVLERITAGSQVVVELDLSACSDHSWHGACLALAELARRGLLLPSRLSDSLPWVLRALHFDQRRGAHSVGAHVRDAACYVLWSFARVYPTDAVQEFAEEVGVRLAVTSVLDREVNVRRAASAAFQEGVGRLGVFPRGLDILTMADYFAVGNRQNAFLSVGADLSKFPEYREPLVHHLVSRSAAHWDPVVRDLAANALGRITVISVDSVVPKVVPNLVVAALDPDVAVHHGAMLSLAEVCLAWSSKRIASSCDTATHDSDDPHFTPDERTKIVLPVGRIINLQPPTFYTSFGSELARIAACRLIECLAEAAWPSKLEELPQPHLETWWDLVTSSLERKEPSVQERAVAAFRALSRRYGCPSRRVDKLMEGIQPISEKFARRGYALALGALPAVIVLRTGVSRVVQALVESAKFRVDKRSNDAESKRNSIVALVQVVETLDAKTVSEDLSAETVVTVVGALVDGLSDFSTDQRGDVGSWIREACMRGVRSVVRIAWRKEREGLEIGHPPKSYLPREIFRNLIAGVLGQSVERIDRLRQTAGDSFTDLLWSGVGRGGNESFAQLYGLDLLEQACPKTATIAWASPSDVFFRMVPLIVIPQYRTELLTGLIVSAGGLTESLVRHSNTCLLDFVAALPTRPNETMTPFSGATFALHPSLPQYPFSLVDFFSSIVEVFNRNKGTDRVIVPLFEVVDTVVSSGVVTRMEDVSVFVDLLELTIKELKKTKDVKKITAGVKILCSCATFTTGSRVHDVQRVALSGIVVYLLHSFPRVRRSTAEQFYVSLTSMDQDDADGEEEGDDYSPKSERRATPFSDKEGLEELLLESDWDQNPTDELKERIHSKLNIGTE
ncbi:ARM repeat-containing protein [Gonapodya prolifera JEL478]|uniref:ARM repeat-containing protein n=1 Tax=Gonapodya prolifera (strain JEL478) TaxID=1344416 RepID=A0A139A5U7_GONPJ|nr:ARM repeat-containing protein [Gonapodya prolifera JEL478]|eukprot:KXS12028.1 ARM repeat-containing protein [Gonapodya prolifera JEL478]